MRESTSKSVAHSISPDEIDTIISAHRPMMISYAKSLSYSNQRDVEDIVQESCLVLNNSLHKFQSEQEIGPWIRGIVRNKFREHRRKSDRLLLLDDPEVMHGIEEVFRVFDHNQAEENWISRLSLLRHCVQRLNPSFLNPIELFYHSKLSLKEIAHRLNMTDANVGQRLSRARRLIKKCIEKQTNKLDT